MTRELNRLVEAAESILTEYGEQWLHAAMQLSAADRTPMQQAIVRLNAALRPFRRV